MKKVALIGLKPSYVEFTSTKGMLRILKPKESRCRAVGLIFICPRCPKNKSHACIFLFDLPNVPEKAKPVPRFIPSLTFESSHPQSPLVPSDFEELTMAQKSERGDVYRLTPGDLKCNWAGYVEDGVVSWEPTLSERLRGLWK